MKKGIRTYIGVGAIAIGIGLLIMFIGLCLGGLKKVDASNLTSIRSKDMKETITSLDFDIPYGKVTVVEGDAFNVEIKDMIEDDYTIEVKNGVWKIKGNNKSSKFKFFNIEIPFISKGKNNFGMNYEPQILITIPEGYKFEKVSIEVGAGTFYTEILHADFIEVVLGAGSIYFDELTVENAIAIDIGAGEVSIENATVKNMDINVGVGRMYYSGYVSGNCDAEAGVGSIKMDLSNSYTDCYYVIDCSLGSVIINEWKASGNKQATVGNSNGKNRFNLECGVGEIAIYNE